MFPLGDPLGTNSKTKFKHIRKVFNKNQKSRVKISGKTFKLPK